MTHHSNSQHDGDDSSVGPRLSRLPATLEALGGEHEHRREILVERAEERGLGRTDAEQAYDIAREVGLDPAYGVALMLEGVSVRLLSSPRPDVGTSEPNEPEWVDTPPEPDVAERERRLRQTFRRLRGHLDGETSVAEAIRAFGSGPDLEPYDY